MMKLEGINLEVIIYTSDQCGYCRALKDWLSSRSVGYKEKNIMRDQEAYSEFLEQHLPGTPYTLINGKQGTKRVLGFNAGRLEALLLENQP
ncbi:hypothetical protein B9K06_22800 [Bacillus sp. OG2]|nr:hypothetical protein B9K06_22800 [Bacillus sp. OG2]